MQTIQNKQRREFIADSAKMGALGVSAILGGSALFVSDANAAQTSGQNLGKSQIIGTDEAIASAKSGARIDSKGYAAFSKDFTFKPYTFTRHPLGERDILIEILYAGICHSDLH